MKEILLINDKSTFFTTTRIPASKAPQNRSPVRAYMIKLELLKLSVAWRISSYVNELLASDDGDGDRDGDGIDDAEERSLGVL